jgi:hypothetical protein
MDGWPGAAGGFGDFYEFLSVFFAMVDAVVDRDPVQPGLQAGLPPESPEVFERLNKDLLGEVAGVVPVFHETVTEAVDLPLVSDHQFVKRRHVAGKIPVYKSGVGI